jgi:hypothetical protein
VLDCLGDGSADRVLPCEATLRRCLQATDAPALDTAVGGWAGEQLATQQVSHTGFSGGSKLTRRR